MSERRRLTPAQQAALGHNNPEYYESNAKVKSQMTRRVWRALVMLHSAGHALVGPSQIVAAIEEETAQHLQTTLVSEHLRRLVDLGWVERLPQGKRRALYRAKEII
jgi:DNA-binding MarR family transcriptional regulator